MILELGAGSDPICPEPLQRRPKGFCILRFSDGQDLHTQVPNSWLNNAEGSYASKSAGKPAFFFFLGGGGLGGKGLRGQVILKGSWGLVTRVISKVTVVVNYYI